MAKHLCEIRFFFFFSLSLFLENAFAFPDLSRGQLCRFYPIYPARKKGVTREIVRINSLMSGPAREVVFVKRSPIQCREQDFG